jgi:lipopolysaccharide transport system permease protein
VAGELIDEEWDLVIRPKKGLLDFHLEELWKYRDLLWLWVRREYIGAYKQTILGPLWHFVTPIFTTLTYWLIFGKIAQLPRDGVPMFLFYNAGITLWNFFSGCFNSSANAFLSNTGIFGKVYFPRLIMPLASMISTLIKFGIQFALFILIYLYFVFFGDYHPVTFGGIFLLPLSLLMMAGTGFGMGIIVSSLTTKYRDLNVFVGFGIQLLLYATPVLYSYHQLPSALKNILRFNPLVSLTEIFKYSVFGVGEFSASSLLYSFGCMIIFLFIGLVSFNKAERNFMDVV